jgi:hypothetical protein
MNPFNGKSLTVEQLQRELEVSRYHSQMLEEELKQANTREELKNVPARKAVEAAQAETQYRKEILAQKDVETALKHPVEPSPRLTAVAPAVVRKSAKALAKEKAEAENQAKAQAAAAAARAAVPPSVTLLSVLKVGGKASVVLEIQGGVTTVSDGEMSPVGPVKVLSDTSAKVGNTSLTVHGQTISRFVQSDTRPAASGSSASTAGPTGPAPAVTSLPPAMPATNVTLPPPPVPVNIQQAINSGNVPLTGKTSPSAMPQVQR